MPTLVCPKCKYHTENEERFCWKCGTRLTVAGKTIFCSSCGAALKPYAEFCSQCGTRRAVSHDSTCRQCGAELKTGEPFCWKCGAPQEEFTGVSPDVELETVYLKGLDDYENKRYVSAVPELKKAAERGHAKAQYYLADCLLNGLGVHVDETEGAHWARKAREQGIDENTIHEKREVLLKKARRGDIYAQYQLGRLVANHYFASKLDYREDHKWLSKAIKQGYAPAQYTLAACYACIANQKNYSGNRQKMKEQVFELYRDAAEHGHAGAIFAVGACYENGEGVKKNKRKAFSLYCQATEAGYQDSLSLFTIGLCYDKGIGTAKNKKKAIQLYQMAIEHGDKILAPEYMRKIGLGI